MHCLLCGLSVLFKTLAHEKDHTMSKTAGGTGWGRMKRKNEQKAPATPSRHSLGTLCVPGRPSGCALPGGGLAQPPLLQGWVKMCLSRQGALISTVTMKNSALIQWRVRLLGLSSLRGGRTRPHTLPAPRLGSARAGCPLSACQWAAPGAHCPRSEH